MRRKIQFLFLGTGLMILMLILSGCMTSSVTYSVSGYVTYNGSGLSGVTISFSDGLPSVTTNSQGYWSQSGLTGSVVVTPSLSGYTFNPPSITVTSANGNVNFIAVANTYSIGGWEHQGYNLDGTYCYPYQMTSSLSSLNSVWSENVNSGDILTGILVNNQMDIVTAGSQNVRVFNSNGVMLWSVNPVQDSGISDGYISAMDIGNINGTMVIGVAVSSGGDSEYNNEPTAVLVYSSNGVLIQTISTPAAWSITDLRFVDLYGNGSFQIVVAVSSGYALSPRGIYVYDYNTGNLLWNFQTAGIPYVNSIGSLNGGNQKDIVVDTFSPYNGYTINGMNDWTTYVILLDPSGNLLWIDTLQTGNQQSSSSAIVNVGNESEIVTFLNVNIGGTMGIYIINPQNGNIEDQYSEGTNYNNNVFFRYSISPTGNIYVWNGNGVIQEFDMHLNLINTVNINGSLNGLVTGSVLSPSNINVLALTSSQLSVFDQNLNLLYSVPISNEGALILTDMNNNGINNVVMGGQSLNLLY